jgi:protein-tyrosine phosphatase
VASSLPRIDRVDIHSHILPHIDDGARDMAEALDMLRMAREDGTSTIVATPHQARAAPERISYAVDALNLEARNAGIDIKILAGCEVKFNADLAEDYRAGKLLTIADQGYLLVEFSFSRAWTSLVNTSLYALQMAGVTAIVAHAERYAVVQENPSILLEMIATGIPVQINAGSLLGHEGVEEQRTAELLLRAGMVHLLASDGHRRDKRMPLLSSGYSRVSELSGPDVAARIEQNATRIIAGRTLNLPEPDASMLRPASPLGRLLGRFRR